MNPADGLKWKGPYRIEYIRENRHMIDQGSGVYVFTLSDLPLADGRGVLYIGKAGNLASRVPSYLADPEKVLIHSPRKRDGSLNRSLRHPGKVLLLVEVQQKMRHGGLTGIWVRWALTPDAKRVETELIKYFNPAYNTLEKP